MDRQEPQSSQRGVRIHAIYTGTTSLSLTLSSPVLSTITDTSLFLHHYRPLPILTTTKTHH